MTINRFINKYFENLEDFISESDLKKCKNYLFIKDFLDRAVDFFNKIDPELLDSYLKKEYREINELFQLYDNFKKKANYPGIVFLEFLDVYDDYVSLKKEIDFIKEKINFDTKQIYLLEEKLKKEENKKIKKNVCRFY